MRTLILCLAVLLAGCQAAPETVSDEQRMSVTENYTGLMQLYRERLQKNPDDHAARVKLAGAHVKAGDEEAADYYLSQIPEKSCDRLAGCWLQKAQLAYNAGQCQLAKSHIERSLAAGQDIYPAKNLLAIILASEGHFHQAKDTFFEARLGLEDESAILNNLAMLEMMEGNYAGAARRLMPLYQSGQSDPTIRANLIISLMRSGQQQSVKQMLLQEYDQPKALRIFAELNNDMNTWPGQTGQAQTDEETS